jgi:hypothetical protein
VYGLTVYSDRQKERKPRKVVSQLRKVRWNGKDFGLSFSKRVWQVLKLSITLVEVTLAPETGISASCVKRSHSMGGCPTYSLSTELYQQLAAAGKTTQDGFSDAVRRQLLQPLAIQLTAGLS